MCCGRELCAQWAGFVRSLGEIVLCSGGNVKDGNFQQLETKEPKPDEPKDRRLKVIPISKA